MKKILGIAFLIAVCFSCHNKTEPFKTIIVKPSATYIDASVVFNDFSIIPLEGNEKSIISEVTKIENTENNIYILDCKQGKLLLFSNTGAYINSIYKIGKGPDEYLTLDDFIIHNDKLLLLSRLSQKLYQYSMTGVLEKVINLDKQYTQLANGQDDKLVFFRDFSSSSLTDLFNIEIFDLKSEKVVHQYSPFLKEQNGELCFGTGRMIFASTNEGLYMTLPLQHKILKVENKGLSTFLAVDFGNKNKLPEGAENFTSDERTKVDKPLIWSLDNLKLNDKYIYFSYVYKHLKYNTIINNKNNTITSGYITADDKIPFDLPNNIILKKDKIITFINPEDINNDFYKTEKISTLIKDRGYLVQDLVNNNNPIIIKLNLK